MGWEGGAARRMELLGESEAAIGLTAEDAVAIFKQKGDSKRGTLSGQVRSRLDTLGRACRRARRARAVCAGLHTDVCVCVCVCVCFVCSWRPGTA